MDQLHERMLEEYMRSVMTVAGFIARYHGRTVVSPDDVRRAVSIVNAGRRRMNEA
jgi:histone H3/H4